MKRTTVNYLVDAVALVDLISLLVTGVIMKWVLPPGSGGGHGRGFRGGLGSEDVKKLLGLGRHDWGDIHFILSLLFAFLILVHLVLHWSWIKNCTVALLRPRRQRSKDSRAQIPDE